MISLSKRLQLVASFVPDNTNILDVGCDHALLSIYLMQTLKKVKVTASDINPNPLEIARDNVKKYKLDKKIKVVLQDGINDIDEKINTVFNKVNINTIDNSIDTVIISGMGGILISKILSNKEKLKNVKNIILSPNNDFPLVRETLVNLGYKIEKEQLVIDNRKTYLVLRAIKGESPKINYFFGTLNNKSLESIYYYTNILNTNTKILRKMPRKYIFKRLKLKQENKKIKKFLLTR